jgi:hypothetical protein
MMQQPQQPQQPLMATAAVMQPQPQLLPSGADLGQQHVQAQPAADEQQQGQLQVQLTDALQQAQQADASQQQQQQMQAGMLPMLPPPHQQHQQMIACKPMVLPAMAQGMVLPYWPSMMPQSMLDSTQDSLLRPPAA